MKISYLVLAIALIGITRGAICDACISERAARSRIYALLARNPRLAAQFRSTNRNNQNRLRPSTKPTDTSNNQNEAIPNPVTTTRPIDPEEVTTLQPTTQLATEPTTNPTTMQATEPTTVQTTPPLTEPTTILTTMPTTIATTEPTIIATTERPTQPLETNAESSQAVDGANTAEMGTRPEAKPGRGSLAEFFGMSG